MAVTSWRGHCQISYIHLLIQAGIQCNEEFPRCGNCQRLKVQCSFEPPTAATSPSSLSQSSAPDLPFTLAIADLRLFHHYIIEVAPLLPLEKERIKLFQEGYVELGFRYHFLLHSMLALSAIHMFSLDTSKTELITQAHAHQNAALRLVNPVILNTSQDESVPVFVFSSTIAIYSLADLTVRQTFEADHEDIIDGMAACIQLCRGIRAVIGPHWPHIRTWMYGWNINWEADVPDSSNALEAAFPELSRLRQIVQAADTKEQQQACLECVEKCLLFLTAVCRLDDRIRELRLIQIALTEIDPVVLDMLRARNPVALVILAYHAAMMHMRFEVWWLKGLPELLLRHIEQQLEARWLQLLVWPKQVVFQGMMAKGRLRDYESALASVSAPTD